MAWRLRDPGKPVRANPRSQALPCTNMRVLADIVDSPRPATLDLPLAIVSMGIDPMSKIPGIAHSSELSDLARVLEERCAAHGIAKGTHEWEDVAARAINHFLAGSTEKEAVAKALRRADDLNK